MLIGNKQIFGIQFEASSYGNKNTLFGRVALWINGHVVGNFEEEAYMGSFNDTFSHIASFDDEAFEIDTSVMELIENNNGNSLMEKCLKASLFSQLGEAFDDFYLAIFYTNKKVIFCWKKANDNEIESIDKDITANIFIIEKQLFADTFKNYRQKLPFIV